MTDDRELKELLERTPPPFASPDLDTWTAAWAISQQKKAQRRTDADDRGEESARKPTAPPVSDLVSEADRLSPPPVRD